MPFTYTITSPTGQNVPFNILGNQLRVNDSSLAPGDYPITVRADDGLGTIIFQTMTITCVAAAPPAPSLRYNQAQNSQYSSGTLTASI